MNNFKYTILTIALLVITSVVLAQDNQVIRNQSITIAYVNSSELLDSLKEKQEATNKLIDLSDNYKKELELMQNEYNKKYSDYITYQTSLSDNIKLRRMQELTQLENRIQEFMRLAQEDIEQQEQMLLQPLKERIASAIRLVGIENNFTIIYDISDSGIAFINPSATDVNQLVKQKLGQ